MGAWREVIRGQHEPIKKKYLVRRPISPNVQTEARFKKKTIFFHGEVFFFLTGPLMGARVELLSVGHTRATSAYRIQYGRSPGMSNEQNVGWSWPIGAGAK